jgi:hypothetical protein
VYWEHDTAKQALQKEVDYWQQKMEKASFLHVPDSYLQPLDKTAPPHLAKLDSTLLEGLAKISQQHKVSLQMSLSAVIALALHRITSQSDICIVTVFEKRFNQDIKNLLASLIAMVPIRIRLSKETSFLDLVNQIKQTTLEAYDHVRNSYVIPLSFLYRTRLQDPDRFVLRVLKRALRLFTWLINRLWFPAEAYPTIFYAILMRIAVKAKPKVRSRRKRSDTRGDNSSTRQGIEVALNLLPNFYQSPDTSGYTCGDTAFIPGTLPSSTAGDPNDALKSEQANALYFAFTKDQQGHPLLSLLGMKFTPSALQQIATTFGEILEAVVKNSRSLPKETTSLEKMK